MVMANLQAVVAKVQVINGEGADVELCCCDALVQICGGCWQGFRCVD